MQNVQQFNKTNLNQLRQLFAEKMREIEKETGVRIELGSIRYDSLSFTSKTKATIVGDNAKEALQKAAQNEWNRACHRYGLKPGDFGKMFHSNGKVFTITGLKTRNSRYPILAETATGRKYKFNSVTVRMGLNQ